MLVVVGLRNPEPEYRGTRHNVGAEVGAVVAGRVGVPFRSRPRRVRCEIAEGWIGSERIIVALPKSNMNVTGPPVASLLAYFQASPEDLLVCHDDIDLDFGRLRLSFGRGSGGHNGVESVLGALGTQSFYRLKVGVGRPPGRMDPADYVLRRFTKAERDEVDVLVEEAADVVELFTNDREAAVQLAGRRRIPPA